MRAFVYGSTKVVSLAKLLKLFTPVWPRPVWPNWVNGLPFRFALFQALLNAGLKAAALANTPYNQAWANTAWTNSALNGTTVAPFAQTGLAHTGVNQGLGNEFANAYANAYTDPYATARIAQTFPFVHWGYSPFGWPTV